MKLRSCSSAEVSRLIGFYCLLGSFSFERHTADIIITVGLESTSVIYTVNYTYMERLGRKQGGLASISGGTAATLRQCPRLSSRSASKVRSVAKVEEAADVSFEVVYDRFDPVLSGTLVKRKSSFIE